MGIFLKTQRQRFTVECQTLAAIAMSTPTQPVDSEVTTTMSIQTRACSVTLRRRYIGMLATEAFESVCTLYGWQFHDDEKRIFVVWPQSMEWKDRECFVRGALCHAIRHDA